MSASVQRVDPHHLRISGPLTFTTVPGLCAAGVMQWPETGAVEINLAEVSWVDSAGLALLVDWLKGARDRGLELRFAGFPEQLRSLLKASGLETIFPSP